MGVGQFEVFKGKDNQWRFRLKAGNGEIIADSEAYKTRQGCLKGITSVQKNAGKAEIEILGEKSEKKMTKKTLIKRLADEEKTRKKDKLPEKVTKDEEKEDEKKLLVDPDPDSGPPPWIVNRIPLPGERGPSWL